MTTTNGHARFNGESFEVTTTVDVGVDRIVDMMIGALEGGSTSWLRSFERISDGKVTAFEKPWYCTPAIYTDRDVRFLAIHDDETVDNGRTTVTAESILKGLEAMATKNRHHFQDMMAHEDDADTADCFMQCVVLGDIVFG